MIGLSVSPCTYALQSRLISKLLCSSVQRLWLTYIMIYHDFSGCITTAESVLIQEQSYSKLLTHLQQMKLNMFSSVVVVAISPQSLASIALFTSLSTVDVFLKLSAILKSLGVAYVIDMSAVGDVALMEAREEFLYRY